MKISLHVMYGHIQQLGWDVLEVGVPGVEVAAANELGAGSLVAVEPLR